MSPFVQEWLNLAVRWAHVIAAIMWIGDSFLFMWLDSKLTKPQPGSRTRAAGQPEHGDDVVGELWMAHSGGFYEVVKRKSLRELPPELFWFKWESYTTWITGFLLLIIVYWAGGRAMLLDATSPLSQALAVGLSAGSLVLALGVYHALCQLPLIKNTRAFGVLGLALVLATAWGLAQVFTPRAMFLQVGAMLGTIMASNVFFIIIPAQRHMLAATKAGQPVDTSYGMRAKQRSTHNHYLTLPVLFTMLSNHFPTLYGHEQAWLVLGLLTVLGAGVKYVMNFRSQTHPVVWSGTAAVLAALVAMTAPARITSDDPALRNAPKVSFATAQAIVQARCTTCHADKPTDPSFAAPPQGVVLDKPGQLAAHADRVLLRAVQTKTMPLGNLTGMTDTERTLLGAWIVQGADENAPGPVQLTAIAPAPKAPTFATPGDEASHVFSTLCATCHGPEGKGDGPAAAALEPKPRNYHDAAWQTATDDATLAKVIVHGGAAVAKSATMPANADLQAKPAVVAEIIKIIRSFRPN